MDDLDLRQFNMKELLKLFDRYPYRIELKGSSAQFNSKRIIITHKDPPKTAFAFHNDKKEILRRIDEIIEFEHDNDKSHDCPDDDSIDMYTDESDEKE